MTSPALSIVVLTHNRRRLLADCVHSIASQTVTEGIDVVIADDGSTDDTEAFSRRYARDLPHVRYVRHQHRGIAATRNLGVRHAQGAIVAIVADDYLLDPSYAETCSSSSPRTPRRQWCGSGSSRDGETGAAASATPTTTRAFAGGSCLRRRPRSKAGRREYVSRCAACRPSRPVW